MNNKTKFLTFGMVSLLFIMVIEILYIKQKKEISNEDINIKRSFVNIVGLPDLAISTEATYIRGRSLTSTFSIFRDDPTIATYFPSTFIIAPNQKSKE